MRRRLEEAEVSRGSHPTGFRNANTFAETRHLRPDLGLRATEERGLSLLRLCSLEFYDLVFEMRGSFAILVLRKRQI